MKNQFHYKRLLVLILITSFVAGIGLGYVIKHRNAAVTAGTAAEEKNDSGQLQVMQTEHSSSAQIYNEKITDTEALSESVDDSESEEPQIQQSDIDRVRDKIEMLRKSNAELEAEAAVYQKYVNGLTKEEIERLVQEKILQCYEENMVLALEVKAFTMESFGVSVPTGFSSEDDAWEDYKSYMKDELIEGILSQFAPDSVTGILKDGVNGALDAYVEQGTLSDALTGALESVQDGVAAIIQDDPLQTAMNILDETTGGIFSTYDNITDYDQTPKALLQSLADNAGKSSEKIKNYLSKESMTSKDIANLMYQYAQYGNTMENLRYYAGGGTFSWQDNYRKMEILYGRFLYNETCIQMLSTGGVSDIAGQENAVETPQVENAEMFHSQNQMPGEVRGDSEQAVLYRELLAEEMQEQAANERLLTEIESYKKELYLAQGYREQVEQVSTQYEKIREYSVMDFKAQYDEAGTNKIQENNKMNNAVGEIAKYTPFRWTVNMFTAMNISDNDWYYNGIARINQNFETAYQQTAVDTRDAVNTLKAKLEVYADLAKQTYQIEEDFTNQYLLGYILNGREIDLSAEWEIVERQLYILSSQVQLVADIYRTLLLPSDAKTRYVDGMTAQYNEIMEIIDPEGTGEAASKVTDEELMFYLKDMIDAAKSSFAMMESYRAIPLGNVNSNYSYFSQGKVYVYKVNGFVSHVTIGGNYSSGSLDLYYAAGVPIYVEGYYCYHGRVLNPKETTDTAALIEEAEWMKGALNNRSEFEKIHYKALKNSE